MHWIVPFPRSGSSRELSLQAPWDHRTLTGMALTFLPAALLKSSTREEGVLLENPKTPAPKLKNSSAPPGRTHPALGDTTLPPAARSSRSRAPPRAGPRRLPDSRACSHAALPTARAPTRLAVVAIGCIGDCPSSLLFSGPRSVRALLAGSGLRDARGPGVPPAGRSRLAVCRKLADALPGTRIGRPHPVCPGREAPRRRAGLRRRTPGSQPSEPPPHRAAHARRASDLSPTGHRALRGRRTEGIRRDPLTWEQLQIPGAPPPAPSGLARYPLATPRTRPSSQPRPLLDHAHDPSSLAPTAPPHASGRRPLLSPAPPHLSSLS